MKKSFLLLTFGLFMPADSYALEVGIPDLESPASISLGYLQNQCIENNCEKSKNLIQQFAIDGDMFGQYALGMSYLLGKGVHLNVESAIFWLKKSAKQGHETSQYFLDKLEHPLSLS